MSLRQQALLILPPPLGFRRQQELGQGLLTGRLLELGQTRVRQPAALLPWAQPAQPRQLQ